MPVLSLDNEINKYLPLLGVKDKQSILVQIKALIGAKEAPKRMSREEFIIQYNKELDDAEAEVRAGHFTSQEDAKKQAASWSKTENKKVRKFTL